MAEAKLRAVAHEDAAVTISPPNLRVAEVLVYGTSPYVQHRFWNKAAMIETQAAGSTAQSKKKRPPKDFEANYRAAMYRSTDGWLGQPASSYRNAMIAACRLVGFKMTHAKLSIFVVADGYDAEGTPLVRIEGEPMRHDAYVRNDNGSVDIRARPMWLAWSCPLRVRYDADQFTLTDVMNLLERAGQQVGIGEGRPNSAMSNGLGWGTFSTVAPSAERSEA